MSTLSYPETIFIGLLQGVSELFPVSSLGHSVLVPALIGGKWASDANMAAKNSPYLDTLVAMHVATAAALVIFFWRDWVRIVGGLFTSIRRRKIDTPDERLAWLLIVGTIPVGIAGVALDKILQAYLGKPIPAAVFLVINGGVLFAVERLHRRRAPRVDNVENEGIPWPVTDPEPSPAAAGPYEETMVIPLVGGYQDEDPGAAAVSGDVAVDRRLAKLSFKEAIGIGACQILALLPGISRSGITMVGGLLRGLRHEDAARFAFLLATPAIAGAGLLKLPDLLRPEMSGSLGPALVGSVVSGIGAYFSVRFLTGYFETRTLNPFGIYCIVAGLGCLAFFLLHG